MDEQPVFTNSEDTPPAAFVFSHWRLGQHHTQCVIVHHTRGLRHTQGLSHIKTCAGLSDRAYYQEFSE